MGALSADAPILDTRPSSGRDAYALTTSTTIHANSFVGVNDAGFVKPWANTANFEFLGLCLEAVASGAALSTPPEQCRIDTSGVTIRNATLTGVGQGDVGELVYCATDNPADLTTTATTNVGAIGYIVRYVASNTCDVRLFTPSEHMLTA